MKNRKHPRLKQYDYSLPGYYFVTIHNAKEAPGLSWIEDTPEPRVHLTPVGVLVQEQLFALEARYNNVRLDKYVIMPDHIHVIIRLLETDQTVDKRPKLTDVVCAFKSIVTRLHNKMADTPARPLFQTSFYETVLRNERAYQECWLYIEGNPGRWLKKTVTDIRREQAPALRTQTADIICPDGISRNPKPNAGQEELP